MDGVRRLGRTPRQILFEDRRQFRFVAFRFRSEQHSASDAEPLPPELPRLFQVIRTKRYDCKTSARERFGGLLHDNTRFRCDRSSPVVFEVADASTFEFFWRNATQRYWRRARDAVIWACSRTEQQLQIADGTRHRPDDSDQRKRPSGGRKMAGRRDSSRSRLKPADPAEVRRDANRASTIAANSAGRTPGRNRRRFPTARTARSTREVPRIICASVE